VTEDQGEIGGAAIKQVLCEAVKIAGMKYPSVSEILVRNGYIYESEQIERLVNAAHDFQKLNFELDGKDVAPYLQSKGDAS
jgi:hypothetical protein